MFISKTKTSQQPETRQVCQMAPVSQIYTSLLADINLCQKEIDCHAMGKREQVCVLTPRQFTVRSALEPLGENREQWKVRTW